MNARIVHAYFSHHTRKKSFKKKNLHHTVDKYSANLKKRINKNDYKQYEKDNRLPVCLS